jgi:hypothetical protein
LALELVELHLVQLHLVELHLVELMELLLHLVELLLACLLTWLEAFRAGNIQMEPFTPLSCKPCGLRRSRPKTWRYQQCRFSAK